MNLVLLLAFAVIAEGAVEGDLCDHGIWKKIKNCPSALQDITNGKTHTSGYDNNDDIVCCKSDQSGTSVLTTTQRSIETTTEYEPTEVIYQDIDIDGKGGCDPIPPVLTSRMTGQIAWDKCIDYQEKYVFPCEKGVSLIGGSERVNRCHHNSDELIIGGTDVFENEFPHMVLLGYQDETNKTDWNCSGSLISEKFVLTAAHCIANGQRNIVSHALVGILNRSDDNIENRYSIKRIIQHENYLPLKKYNDIALLELDRDVPLSHTLVPACLHTGDSVDESRAFATGWGTIKQDSMPDTLQKVILDKFTFDECSEKFKDNNNLLEGVDDRSQVCYGDKTKSKDICQGDSGGPLQVKNKKISCMYTLVGVTSIGQACGVNGIPGIYTRVSNYLPWIESIVWPN